MADNPKQESPILHVVVVGFHHKKGCQVEYSYPPLIPGNPVDSHEIPVQWKHLPSLALPDGAHNYTKDTIYFHLPAITDNRETVYGVSCYRQMDATELLNRGAEVTRNTVQKSVCVLSKLPLYGLIQAKLELITHAYFRERDFSHVDLLEDTYKNLSASLSDGLLQGTQAFLGLPVRDVVQCFKHKILLLFKLVLLERRVLVFGSPVQPICSTLLALLSLFPGMIEFGLQESSCSSSKRQVSPTLKLTKITDSSEEFLEVSYTGAHDPKPPDGGTSPELQNPCNVELAKAVRHESGGSHTSVGSLCNATEHSALPANNQIDSSNTVFSSSDIKQERSSSLSSGSGVGRHKPLFERQTSLGSFPGTAKRTSSISAPLRQDSLGSGSSMGSEECLSSSPVINNNSTSVFVHRRHNSGGSRKLRNSPNKENRLSFTDHNPHIDGITHVEAVQEGEPKQVEQSFVETPRDSNKFDPLSYLGEITKIKPIQKISARAERLSSGHDDNLSPDERELLDSDECFSWEEDRLLLEIDEILDSAGAKAQMRRSEKLSSFSRNREHSCSKHGETSGSSRIPTNTSLDDPLHVSSKRMSEIDDSQHFSDLDLKVHRTVKTHHTNTNLDQSSSNLVKSDSKSSLDSVKSSSSGSSGKTGSSLKLKIPRSEKRKTEGKTIEMQDMRPISPTSLKVDQFGLPLAVFTKGMLCHPYLSLQYYDLLQDVNARGFLVGATNILFKQKRNLLDVILDLTEPRIEVNDRELAKSLTLTTADLRFADYIVKCVSDDRGDIFLDDTGWEGGDEWIRSQFRMYLLHLLATAQNDDEKLYEDYNVAFIHAWKSTHNYKLWRGTPKEGMVDVIPGHPFQGGLSVADMKLRFAHSMQSTDRGKKLSAALGQTGKVVTQTGKSLGGAFSTAKTAVSSWFSSWRGDRTVSEFEGAES